MNSLKKNEIDNFLSAMVSNGAYPSKENLKFKYDQVFGNIDFEGKNVLEIGGGPGIFCFYASMRGARLVINLEPEGDGCKTGDIGKFQFLKNALGDNKVELIESTFQEYEPVDTKFDIILLYNSINHLDEKACIDLLISPASWETYKAIFRKIHQLANSDARVIIGDCSNKNFFPSFGLKNPIYKGIEWHKHQSPNVWTELLKECGFANPAVTWTSFNTFGKPGQLLLGNRIVSYFLISHFVLRMDKK